MTPFINFSGLVVPLDRANIDTDAILPKQFMKSLDKTGLGPNLFDEWRYLDKGEPGQDCTLRPRNPAFSLNQARYQGAEILITRDNFGCGSSREHAPWALMDFGIRAIIAPSFADIFHNNCFKNGILPIAVPGAALTRIFEAVAALQGYRLSINLEDQTISTPGAEVLNFEIDEFRKRCLMEGLDDIALTLNEKSLIRAYETTRRLQESWLFT